MGGEKLRVLSRVTFDCPERFGSVRHTRRVAEIDKPFVGQFFMQRPIDGQPAYAAVENADGKRGNCRLPLAACRLVCAVSEQVKLAIGNRQLAMFLVEAPGIEPGSKSQRRRTLHA